MSNVPLYFYPTHEFFCHYFPVLYAFILESGASYIEETPPARIIDIEILENLQSLLNHQPKWHAVARQTGVEYIDKPWKHAWYKPRTAIHAEGHYTEIICGSAPQIQLYDC